MADCLLRDDCQTRVLQHAESEVNADCALAAADLLPGQRTLDAHRRRMQHMGHVISGMDSGGEARGTYPRNPTPGARAMMLLWRQSNLP